VIGVAQALGIAGSNVHPRDLLVYRPDSQHSKKCLQSDEAELS